jgi:protein-L-isoaspartate(D-aspartate) O-methyltransferase
MSESGAGEEARFVAARARMVSEQLERRGIRDRRVLAALGAVPRHLFVDRQHLDDAYDDRPLPIGLGQTISQPFMVARATELAEPRAGERALEVGAGCGYQAAVLAYLVGEVFAIELQPRLATRATDNLAAVGVRNVTVGAFDGGAGWPAHAPYDVIIVSAGAPRVPPLLVAELADGGRLVVPVGPPEEQTLVLVRRVGDGYETTPDTRCRYVELRGRYGVGSEPPSA